MSDASPMTFRGRLLAVLLRTFALLPFRANQSLGAAIGWLFWRIPNRSRKVAFRNMELCFPKLDADQRAARVRNNMRATGQGLTELGWCWYRPMDRVQALIRTIHGVEHLDEALDLGQGVLIAAPHLGSWEMLAQYLPTRSPLAVLYREPRDSGIEKIIVAGRSRMGQQLIRADGRGVREVFRAVAKGKLMGILPDQQPKQGQGVFAPFFGIQAMTMVLLSKLATRTRAPVVFGFAERLPSAQGYDLHFFPAEEAIFDPDLETSVAALNRGVEACVRACPDQYAWGYKRFSIRPEGDPPLY